MKNSQNKLIRAEFLICLAKGMTCKSEIMDVIENKYGIPRPSIRRIKKDLLEELKFNVKVLT